MQPDSPPVAGRPDGLSLLNWDRPPYNRWSFQHVGSLLPVAAIPAADEPCALERGRSMLRPGDLSIGRADGSRASGAEVLDGSWTDGLLALSHGRIVLEDYRNHMTADSLHLTQSVSKSVVGAVAGVLHHGGSLDLDRTVANYVPDFAVSAYADVTVRQLLDMNSGVDFPEDVIDPASGQSRMDIAVGWKPAAEDNPAPRSLRGLIRALSGCVRPHGAEFEYRSMETEVLGFCLEAAAIAPLPRLVSDLVWRPMGAATAASFGLDPEGATIADGALSASLSDLARFGLLFAREGVAQNGRQVIPAAWVAETRAGDGSRFPARYRADRPNGAYRNQFWIEDTRHPVTLALGVYGQMIFIDPDRDFVGVKLSTWPTALDPGMRIEAQALMHELAAACTE